MTIHELAVDLPEDRPDEWVVNRMRILRNGALKASDWTQLSDAPVDAAAWATYRQELRDYPAQSDKVSTLPAWPTPPE